MANAGGKAATTTRAPDHGATVPAEEGTEGGTEESTAPRGRGLRGEAQQVHAPEGADKAQEIKRYVGPFYVEVGFVCLDALAGRITHSSKLERLIR